MFIFSSIDLTFKLTCTDETRVMLGTFGDLILNNKFEMNETYAPLCNLTISKNYLPTFPADGLFCLITWILLNHSLKIYLVSAM